MLDQAIAYWTDAWQRSVLTLEALNERGNIHLAQATKDVPNVLNFAVELILDGREFERPVNYGLVRILPPEGAAIDPAKPPIVVVDPRAGHGPGIGGMKPDSEIGVATRAGHPCYTEATFLNVYGSPFLQAVVGLMAEPNVAPRHIERDLGRESAAAELRSALDHRYEAGTADECALRALIFARRPDGAADERGFRMLKIIRDTRKANRQLTLSQIRDMVKEQLQLVLLDEERAIKALPKLLHPGEPEFRRGARRPTGAPGSAGTVASGGKNPRRSGREPAGREAHARSNEELNDGRRVETGRWSEI